MKTGKNGYTIKRWVKDNKRKDQILLVALTQDIDSLTTDITLFLVNYYMINFVYETIHNDLKILLLRHF